MRTASRIVLTLVVAAVLAPAAHAAGPTATTAAPTLSTTPQTAAPGSAFGPIQGLTDTTPTQTSVVPTKRAGTTSSGRSTLLFLSLAALLMITAVGGYIWYEGRKMGSSKRRRRQRMRSGRTPQPAGAGTGARRGPPPPPRKRRAQAAKRRKR